MIKFLVDESTGLAVAEYLRQAGYDTAFVGEKMFQASGEEVLAFAVRENLFSGRTTRTSAS